jgi:arylformamidase
MKIIDITYDLDEKIAVWPGDQKYEIGDTMTMDDGYSCNVSSIKMSLHTGTHTDAHYHYSKDGLAMNDHKLENYLGLCQVIDVSHAKGPRITCQDIKDDITEKRLLLKTRQSFSREAWEEDFKGLDTTLIEFLHSKGLVLIGTDAPSVDVFDDKKLLSHQALLKADMYNLENLKLRGVEPGVYELIALPLKIKRGDASPVRAVLIRK